jgi:hypothetical protein
MQNQVGHSPAAAPSPLRITLVPNGGMASPGCRWHSRCMRMNLITQACTPASGKGAIPLTLTIKPACGLPGEYQYLTDSTALLKLLRQTDLPAAVIQRFEGNMFHQPTARLLGVELSDSLLTDVGYFVD